MGRRIPDYGGPRGYFDCFHLEQDRAIGYTSTRARLTMTWVLTVRPVDDSSRVLIRLRISTRRRAPSLLMVGGKVVDRLTITGLAAGLRERVTG